MIELSLKLIAQWLIDFAPLMTILFQKSLDRSSIEKTIKPIKTIQNLIESYDLFPQVNESGVSFEQQKVLQQQLAIYQRETQLKIASFQRETTLNLPEINKVYEHWPLNIYPSQILESHSSSKLIPLKIFLASPQLLDSLESNVGNKNINFELRLAENLRTFLNKNYSLHSPLRPTEFLACAWENKRFHGDSSIKAMFGMLKSEPTLILESEIEGDNLSFRIAYWGLGQENYYYQTLAKFSYQQILQESAKRRALKWKATREQLLALGEDIDEVNQLGRDNVINLNLLEKEEKWQAKGIDTKQLCLDYQINSEDLEQLCQLLSACCCLVTGSIADIYHLINRDIPPLLPALLPSLAQQLLDSQLIGAIVSGYRQVYQTLERDRSYWVPELSLQLGHSLTHLPEKSWAIEQINYSLQSWLNLRQIQISPADDLLDAIEPALTIADRDYLAKLQECFTALGDSQRCDRISELLKKLTPILSSARIDISLGKRENTGSDSSYPSIELIYTLTGHSGANSSIAITPDGKTLASGCADKTIEIWDLHKGELIRTIAGHSEAISSVAISPDGEFLASSSILCPKSNVKVWNLKTGKLLHSRLGHKKSVRFVAIDRKARILVSGSNKIKIWNLHTGDRLCTLWHSCAVNAATISPDGQILVSGGSDGKIKLWNPLSGDPLCTLKGHTDAINAVVISPDGKFLLSGSVDRTIKVWHLSTGKLQQTFEGHNDAVNAVTISPDGKFLISGSADRTIKIWHLVRGELRQSLQEHSGGVTSVVLSLDGRTLVSGSSDKTIKIWRVSI
jgi:WD40 repeat protein